MTDTPKPPETPEPAGSATPAPAGQDVRFERLPGEHEAAFEARTRHLVPLSESPSDIVPNRPNISMGQPIVEEAPPLEEAASPEHPIPIEQAVAAAEAEEDAPPKRGRHREEDRE